MPLSKLQIIEKCVREQQYTKVSMLIGTKRRKIILDVTTANLLLKMFQSAPINNISKLEALTWDRLVNLAWNRAA